MRTFADSGRTVLLAEGLTDENGVFKSQVPTSLTAVYYEYTPVGPRFGTTVGSYGTGGSCRFGATVSGRPSENHACLSASCFLPASKTLIFSSSRGPDFEIHYQESGTYAGWWLGEGRLEIPFRPGASHCPAAYDVPVVLRYSPVHRHVNYSFPIGPLEPGGGNCPGGTGGGQGTSLPDTATVISCPPDLEIAVTDFGTGVRWATITEPEDPEDDEPDSAPPAYPSLAKQAASALGSAARFVASGGATVSQEEFDRRRAICLACPTRRYVAAEDRCEACGCYLSIKPWGKAEACPDGHW